MTEIFANHNIGFIHPYHASQIRRLELLPKSSAQDLPTRAVLLGDQESLDFFECLDTLSFKHPSYCTLRYLLLLSCSSNGGAALGNGQGPNDSFLHIAVIFARGAFLLPNHLPRVGFAPRFIPSIPNESPVQRA